MKVLPLVIYGLLGFFQAEQIGAGGLGIESLAQYGAIGIMLIYFLVKDYRYQVKLFELADKITDSLKESAEDKEWRYRMRTSLDDIETRLRRVEALNG